MTFCVVFARGQQLDEPGFPANGRILRVERTCRFPAGPVSVRREADAQPDCTHEKDLQMQAFLEAAEGIRTLDLLHGKQSVCVWFGADIPCKHPGSPLGSWLWDSPAFTASSRGLGHRMGTRRKYVVAHRPNTGRSSLGAYGGLIGSVVLMPRASRPRASSVVGVFVMSRVPRPRVMKLMNQRMRTIRRFWKPMR
jgi:hypothetical protein